MRTTIITLSFNKAKANSRDPESILMHILNDGKLGTLVVDKDTFTVQEKVTGDLKLFIITSVFFGRRLK